MGAAGDDSDRGKTVKSPLTIQGFHAPYNSIRKATCVQNVNIYVLGLCLYFKCSGGI